MIKDLRKNHESSITHRTSMNKILTLKQATIIGDNLKKQNKHIVLVGGCFDILHTGHIIFLEKAKQEGDILMVLLESDEAVTKTKGENRPIHTQKDRAQVLAALQVVDYVILLPHVLTNLDYDDIIQRIKPFVLATTKGDPNRQHKERQAKTIQAKLVDVTENILDKSTSKLAQILREQFSL